MHILPRRGQHFGLWQSVLPPRKECLQLRALTMGVLVSASKETSKLNVDVKMVYALTTEQNSKKLFSCLFALLGIAKLGRNLWLAISWLLAMPSKCCVSIWCHSCISCFDMLSITPSVAENSFFGTLAFGNFSESSSFRGQCRLLWRCCHLFWRMSLGMWAIANGGYGVSFLKVEDCMQGRAKD